MSTLYLDKRGMVLTKKNHLLVVKCEGEASREVLPEMIERIILYNGCTLTSDALSLILKYDIPLSILDRHRFAGYLNPSNQKNTPIRYQQYEVFRDTSLRLEIFKEILDAKIYNQYRFLKKHLSYKSNTDYDAKLKQIDTMRRGINTKTDIDSLMGYEGMMAKVFFSIFGAIFPDPFSFSIRTRRPPKDPANAVLSFGYSVLLSEINSFVLSLGLDPNVGFIHTMDYSRPSLSLDILEEFRFVIDSVTLALFNRNMLKPEDFEESDDRVYLNETGRKRFFESYEEKMRTKQTYLGEKRDYRDIIKLQTVKVKKFVQHQLPYVPYKYNQE